MIAIARYAGGRAWCSSSSSKKKKTKTKKIKHKSDPKQDSKRDKSQRSAPPADESLAAAADLGAVMLDCASEIDLGSFPTSVAWPSEAQRESSRARLSRLRKQIDKLQQRMYAESRSALLCIFQAMDAGGKDSTVRNVFSGVNPAGFQVHSFKAPVEDELLHDFLWRASRQLPPRGCIGVFSRSYYEEITTVRVHPEFLAAQRLPPPHDYGSDRNSNSDLDPSLWHLRAADIVHYEAYLRRQGVHIVKFFLHVSRIEQARRLLSRMDDPTKHWKLARSDITERRLWGAYQAAWTDALRTTAHAAAPWWVIPADDKAAAREMVAAVVESTLRGMDMRFPPVSEEQEELIVAFRGGLVEEMKG